MKRFYVLIILFTFDSYAQNIKLQEGDISLLKGISNYNLVFKYDDLQIVNYSSEKEYLDEIVITKESIIKGKGKLYKYNWYGNRTKLYEPFFENSFNNYLKKKKIFACINNTNAEYTILINSLKLNPGFKKNMSWESAKLWAKIIIYKNNNPEQILISFEPIKIYKGDYNMDFGIRIANAYSVLAKSLAKSL